MNRPYLVLYVSLIIFSLCSLGFSQSKFGLRGGLNLASVSEDLSGSQTIDVDGIPIEVNFEKSKYTSYSIGGVAEFWLNPAFALQINALYNQKGVKIKGDVNTTVVEQGSSINVKADADETLKLSYLSFPLLGKFAFGQANVKPFVMAGPEIGFLLSAKDKTKATVEAEALGEKVGPITVDEEEDIKELFKTFEFAINFGAGVMIPLGNVDAFIDGQYSLGLTKLDKEGESSTKNQVILIHLGVLFGG